MGLNSERTRDFLGDISYQGQRRVLVGRGGCFRGTCWLLATLVLWLLLSYSVATLVMYYLAYPIETVTLMDAGEPDVALPVVTVCNKNALRQTTSNNPAQKANESLTDYYKRSGHQTTVTSCQYRPNQRQPDPTCARVSIQPFLMFPYGICYSINYDGVLKVNGMGLKNGLTLMLDIENTAIGNPARTNTYSQVLPEYFVNNVNGLMVVFHGHHEQPNFSRREKLFLQSGDSDMDVVISGVTETHRLPPPYSLCSPVQSYPADMPMGGKRLQFQNTLPFSRTFDSECVRCAADRVARENKCKLYGVPYFSQDTPDCSPYDPASPDANNTDVAAFATLKQAISGQDCGCRKPCKQSHYEYKTYNAYQQVTATEVNKFALNIYFESLDVDIVETRPVYSLGLLMRDMAIHFVIYVGFNLITFLHLFEYILDIIFGSAGCANKNSHVVDAEISGDGNHGDSTD